MVDDAPEWQEVGKQLAAHQKEQDAELARRWLHALQTAPIDGKEPFDLETFASLHVHYDDYFDRYGYLQRSEDPPPRPFHPVSWGQEARMWEKRYYRESYLTMQAMADIEAKRWQEHQKTAQPRRGPERPKRRPPDGQKPPFREPEDQAEHDRLIQLADQTHQDHGKETFDYNTLVALLDNYQPNVDWTREQEIRWWKQQYYDHHPNTLTLTDLATTANQHNLNPPTTG